MPGRYLVTRMQPQVLPASTRRESLPTTASAKFPAAPAVIVGIQDLMVAFASGPAMEDADTSAYCASTQKRFPVLLWLWPLMY